jgi:hypothetical protein
MVGDQGARGIVALAEQLHIKAARKPIARAHHSAIGRRRDENHGVERLGPAEIEFHPLRLRLRGAIFTVPAEPGRQVRRGRGRQVGELFPAIRTGRLDLPQLRTEPR